jgi:predicted nucleic acid-binding protein
MILLVDASAAVDLLVRSDSGERVRRLLTDTRDVTLMTVAHLDAEVLSVLARLHRGDVLSAEQTTGLLERLATMAMQRLPITGRLLQGAWDLRDNVAARDAPYVAAAQAVRGQLLITDDRLARAVPDLAVGSTRRADTAGLVGAQPRHLGPSVPTSRLLRLGARVLAFPRPVAGRPREHQPHVGAGAGVDPVPAAPVLHLGSVHPAHLTAGSDRA